jgi:hypothetical protein
MIRPNCPATDFACAKSGSGFCLQRQGFESD